MWRVEYVYHHLLTGGKNLDHPKGQSVGYLCHHARSIIIQPYFTWHILTIFIDRAGNRLHAKHTKSLFHMIYTDQHAVLMRMARYVLLG